MKIEFLWVKRTPAANRFRDRAGYANYRLNTIVVGLEGVKHGTATKPADLAVRWEPINLATAAALARGYATNSMMVYVVDALDGYMTDLGKSETWIKDRDLTALLRNEFYTNKAELHSVTAKELNALVDQLPKLATCPSGLENLLREFTAHHFGRRKRPSMRLRFNRLAALSPAIPSHYRAAVHLLISWRNRHVHGRSSEKVDAEIRATLLASRDEFYLAHAHLEIDRMLQNYDADRAPSLKEISSLISVLHRVISQIDIAILSIIDAEILFIDALTFAFSQEENAEGRVKEYWGKSSFIRQRKLAAMAGKIGFRRGSEVEAPGSLPVLTAEQLRKIAEMPADLFAKLVDITLVEA